MEINQQLTNRIEYYVKDLTTKGKQEVIDNLTAEFNINQVPKEIISYAIEIIEQQDDAIKITDGDTYYLDTPDDEIFNPYDTKGV